jgi:hypothetical protein
MPPRLQSWLKAVLRWLVEPRLFWVAVSVVAFAGLLVLRPGVRELEVRVIGLTLEWLGIGTVAYGIRETRKLFGHPSARQLARAWMLRFPRWRRRVVVGAGAGSIGISGASAQMYVWSNVDPAAPLQEQLNAVARNTERLNERLNQLQSEVDKDLLKHSEALQREQESRARADSDLQLRLEAAETGGLHITFMGVVWLFVGVTLSTLSSEIVQLLS